VSPAAAAHYGHSRSRSARRLKLQPGWRDSSRRCCAAIRNTCRPAQPRARQGKGVETVTPHAPVEREWPKAISIGAARFPNQVSGQGKCVCRRHSVPEKSAPRSTGAGKAPRRQGGASGRVRAVQSMPAIVPIFIDFAEWNRVEIIALAKMIRVRARHVAARSVSVIHASRGFEIDLGACSGLDCCALSRSRGA